jgi:hypothetical protein
LIICRLDFLASRLHLPHWLTSKEPNEQYGVLCTSAGAVEEHFEGKLGGKFITVFSFLHCNCPVSWAIATQKKLTYLVFHCLDHPPYSPDLASSDYHLFSGLKNKFKFAIFRPTWSSLVPRSPV